MLVRIGSSFREAFVMSIKKIISLFFLLLGFVELRAQVDAQFSQYWALPNYYNAGAVGQDGKLNIRAGSRQQWVGMPGAPKTFLVSAEMPFRLFKQNHGVGLAMTNETLGLYSNMTIALQYAYKVRLWQGQLSLGLQLGLLDQRFDGTEVSIPESDYHNSSDDGIPQSELQGMAFDMGFGVFYSHKYFYAGLSSTHLTEPVITFDEKYETYTGRSYYFIAGGNIPFKNALYELQPSLLLKTTFQITQVELTARLRYNKFLWGGLSYRWKDALVIMIGADYKNFMLGYSYDFPVSAIVKATSGSHEVFLGYSLKIDFSNKNKNKHKSIRIL